MVVPQPWNLMLTFSNVSINADTNFDSQSICAFCRHVGTCTNMLCSFSLVSQCRESIISNQIFRDKYCSLFTSFSPLFILIVQHFSSHYLGDSGEKIPRRFFGYLRNFLKAEKVSLPVWFFKKFILNCFFKCNLHFHSVLTCCVLIAANVTEMSHRQRLFKVCHWQ